MRIAIWVKTGVIGFFSVALVLAAATQLGGQGDAGEAVPPAVDQPAHSLFTAELAHRWPTCRAEFPDGRWPAFVLTQPYADAAAPVERMSTDKAWAMNDDSDPTNDVWWVAKCHHQ